MDAGGRVIGVNSAILHVAEPQYRPRLRDSDQPGCHDRRLVDQERQGDLSGDRCQCARCLIGCCAERGRHQGPAGKAGLKAGDLITKMDGQPVATMEELIVGIRTQTARRGCGLGLRSRVDTRPGPSHPG